MQIRPTVVARPLVRPQAVQSQAPAPKAPVKARTSDPSFGSEMFQTTLYSLSNLAQIVTLPTAIGSLLQAFGGFMLGGFNVVMGAMNTLKDIKGLSKAGNTKKSDDYTRLAGDAAIVAGGVALFLSASVAPGLAVAGAVLGTLGFAARAVGIWNDNTRW